MSRSVSGVLLTGLALVAGSAVPAVAAPAVAAPAPADPATVRWEVIDLVSLGDSYSAGLGASSDAVGVPSGSDAVGVPSGTDDGSCRRSDKSYPALWAARHHPRSFAFVACNGATTFDVLSDQVSAVNRDTDLVTITIGGNDVGFVPVLGGCTIVDSDAACESLVEAAEWVSRRVLPMMLARVYLTLRERAPHATVIVLGYPRLFEPTADCADLLVPNATRRAVLNEGADLLDTSIRRVAESLGLRFVDVRSEFAGHGVCSARPWIVAPTGMPLPDGVYHPNEWGYRYGYLAALERAIAG